MIDVEKNGGRELDASQGDESLRSGKKKRRVSGEESDTNLRRKRLEKFDKVNVNLFNEDADDNDEDQDLMKAIQLSKLEAEKSKSKIEAEKSKLSNSKANFSLGADFGDSFNMSDVAQADQTKPSTSQGPVENIPVGLQLQKQYQQLMSTKVAQVNRHVPEFSLKAGTYDVLLCVDNTETTGGGVGGRKTLREETARHLKQCGVMFDRRNLNIGDFLWIAQERVPEVRGQFQQRQPRELVLPYIVERKRLDDLWQSVKDGRYEEQKFRLKGCGLTHLHYLIEDYKTKREFWGRAGGAGGFVTPEAIEQAIANTAVQEGFVIKRTEDQKGTIEYLTLITRLLRDKYQNQDLTSCTFNDINDGLSDVVIILSFHSNTL